MPRPDPRPQSWSPRRNLPPFLVIAAPDDHPLTPDDLIIQPAWTLEDIEEIWDEHDGRNSGTLVVGVYKHDPADGMYKRDRSHGIMGDIRKTGPANPDEESHLI